MLSTRRAATLLSAAALFVCVSVSAQEKGHSTALKTIVPATTSATHADAKKGTGTGGYSQAAADRWHASQALAATHKVGGNEAGEVHKTGKTGLVGAVGTQRKGWVYTGHVRRPHTDAK